MKSLRAAISYFSVLPAGRAERIDAAALAWLPFVGAAVGAIAGGLACLVALVAPHPLAVATAFGALTVLTGAIHLDGFLDGCDAFFASVAPARRLEILKDPHHGTFALAGVAVLTVVLVAALWPLAPARLPLALALAGASARGGAVVQALFTRYGGAGANAGAFETHPPLALLLAGCALIVALAVPLGTAGAIGAAVAVAASTISLRWAASRLGGIVVGDAYGFAIVIGEVAGLAALAAATR